MAPSRAAPEEPAAPVATVESAKPVTELGMPATVVMTPAATDRTTKLSVSAIKSAPDNGCTATASGVLRRALVAAPPSPVKPAEPPVPAAEVMMPVPKLNWRTAWLPLSAM